jgi:hypothetical protein
MDSVSLIKILLGDLANQIGQLSKVDIKKIENGTHELSLNLVKKKGVQSDNKKFPLNQMEELLKHLNECESREAGHAIISKSLKNKNELEQFARHLDVLVLKQDKVDHIKDKIIEATIGATLRSNAIQGKNITKQINSDK